MLKAYWSLGIVKDVTRIPKRISSGRIKFPNHKTLELETRELIGESLEEIRNKLHSDIDLLFYNLAKEIENKIRQEIEKNTAPLHTHNI